LGAIFRGGRSRSSSPGVESHADFDRSRSADRGAGEQEVFVSVTGGSPSTGSRAEPAKITERLRQVLGPDGGSLPVLVGIVCAQLAQPSCARQTLRKELKDHLAAQDLEDFLEWLDKERHQAQVPPDRPTDPRRSSRTLKEGEMVKLCGLEKRPDLNGSNAEVVRVNDPSQPGRIVVKLDSGSQLAIRPQNMQRAATSPEEPAEPEQAKMAEAPRTPKKSTASGDPSSSSIFGAAFAKLKAKAEAEARGELQEKRKVKDDLDKRGGIGSSQPAGQARREQIFGSAAPAQSEEVPEEENRKREPIAFVAAEDRHEPPSRKVTVIDPRRQKRPLEESESDEDVVPGVVRMRPKEASQGPVSPVHKAAKAPPEPVCQMRAAPPRGLAKTVPSSPSTKPSFPSSPASRGKNMTLVVSDDAKEAEKAQRELSDKKRAMEEGKRQMLEKLTKQLQICLSRLQKTDLDDKAKEKYQDMITSLKAQMLKIGNV